MVVGMPAFKWLSSPDQSTQPQGLSSTTTISPVYLDVTTETSWSLDYNSAKSCNNSLEDQLKLRKKALDNPLKVDDILTCCGLSLLPSMMRYDSGFANTSPSHRPLISPLLPPQTIPRHHSLARTPPLSPPITVVLKLYQQSLAPLPYWEGMWLTDFYYPIDWVARREAKASELLEDLEGSFLPYSYGIYESEILLVEPPCGEKSWGHITVFIDGARFGDFVMAHQDDRTVLEQLFASFMHRVHKLRLRGVLHKDISKDNILVIPSSSSPPLVFIDFGSCDIWDHTSPGYNWNQLNQDQVNFIRACEKFEGFNGIPEAWFERVESDESS
ncbi:hypothetical protein JAAARDRAFT_195374 [Jaapia argillacea MUCL 33604]|uniref:Uncharacterized protein n=1 Tax=Jaapia argillacea MUCL 33604 TaxID=933084 RepID=A0A067Q0Q0_9AGAM|nr:hypothetical protein JAAARDRAFT_195374 [Jaapia argillacea MUCL 33604]